MNFDSIYCFDMNKYMEAPRLSFWRKCTTCKKPIGFCQKYWICSVSTCNRVRTGLVFCDLKCFDAHVPVLNHRDAGAFERKSPSQAEFQRSLEVQTHETKDMKAPTLPSSAPTLDSSLSTNTDPKDLDPNEILVVVSKVKDYIRKQSGMNTSASVMDVLSNYVRTYADQAIAQAEKSFRKTVLDRDVPTS